MREMSLEAQQLLVRLADNPGCEMLSFPALRSFEAAGFIRRDVDDERRYWLTHAGAEVGCWLKAAKVRT